MDITRMKESTRLELRRRCLNSLFSFCIAVMGYDDMTDTIHKDLCEFLERPERFKQLTMPRGFLKTSITSIAFPIWMTLPRASIDEFPKGIDPSDPLYNLGTNIRILIASNVITNAAKVINKIRKTFERSRALMALFPEIIPQDFTKVKWSDLSACANRSEDYPEGTFEPIGIGGAGISRHYDIIIESDLIYAKKDDLTGKELQPNQDDIEKAIGWHKLAHSLFVPKRHIMLINEGTRWAKHDLIDHIRTEEKHYKIFDVPAALKPPFEEPTWPEVFNEEKLEQIYRSQGPYMYSTQYLNKPMAPEDMLFKRSQLQFYTDDSEVPSTIRKFTTVDLAGWGISKRAHQSRAVVITCGWCHLNHLWVLHYDVGRFDPSEVIKLITKHNEIFKPEIIGVESIYYQKSLAHFARQEMERGNIPWMSIRQIKPEGRESKEVRIRALEPMASNLAIHCKSAHSEFIEEFCDYVPNNDACKKDILDALSYQIQIARPGQPLPRDKGDRNNFQPVGSMDDYLKWAWRRANPKDRFGNELPPLNPFEDEGIVGDDLVWEAIDPFSEEWMP